MTTPLPKCFCWSRFGTEAGEPIDAILRRKELERRRNGGIFLWGIGNALGPSMRALLREVRGPEVVFSPIRSAPSAIDVSPSRVVTWGAGRDLDGAPVALPRWSIVTSRAPADVRSARHYALVCYADEPLELAAEPGTLTIGQLENLLTHRRVGASQVTAIVRCRKAATPGTVYSVAMRARLVAPYFVELTNPRVDGKAIDQSRGQLNLLTEARPSP